MTKTNETAPAANLGNMGSNCPACGTETHGADGCPGAPAAAPVDPLAGAPADLTPTESVRVEAAAMGTHFLNVYFEGCAIHFQQEHNAASDLNGSNARRGATWALCDGVWKLWDSKGLSDVEAADAAGREPDADSAQMRVVGTVDITPTWGGILQTLLMLLEAGDMKGRATAREELRKMSRLADERNELAARVAALEAVAIEANETAHCVPGMAGAALAGALRAAGWDCPDPAGADVLQEYRLKGDGCQAPGAIVLRQIAGAHPYVVHFRNDQDTARTGRPCYYFGDYCETLADAWQAFADKVRRFDPTGALGA